MELLFQIFMFPRRIAFRWKNRTRLQQSDALTKILRSRCDDARRADSEAYRGLYNVGLFVVLLERDISAYSESIFFARSEWHRQFHARGLALLLHEAAEDLPQLLGKQYRQWMRDLNLGEVWFDALNSIGKKLSCFRKAHGDFLYDVRNYVGAHRDHDAITQIDTMAKFNSIDVYRLAAELSEPVRDVVAFYTRLLQYMHNPIVMIRHVARMQSEKSSNVDGGSSHE
jgi:hypothetical protein